MGPIGRWQRNSVVPGNYCELSITGKSLWFFGLLGGMGGGGKRAKNIPQWKITITSVTCHISGTVYHMIMILVHLCKIVISPGVFSFFLFQILIFWAVREVKGKRVKNSPKWKWQLNILNAISNEPYSIWSWFLVHLCKMMISRGVFFFSFSKFWFLGC